MNASPEISRFASGIHACAMQMLYNASFIQKELPSLEMPDSLRDQITKLCSDLIGSKHDLIDDSIELEEAMVEGASHARLIERVKTILRWIQNDVSSIQECVEAINEAVKSGIAPSIVATLVMESAANILNAIPALPSCCTPSADGDKEEEIEDEGEEPEPDEDCYGFHSEDSYPIGQLVDAIRDLMERPDLPPETLEQIRVFLFAMERLPLVTPGVRMGVGLRLDQGGESDWIEIRMEDGAFTLGRGSWIDGDADTETVFEVSPDYRDGDAFQASNFAQSFLSCAEDVCRDVVIDDSSDEPFNGWDLEQDKSRWGSLPCSFL